MMNTTHAATALSPGSHPNRSDCSYTKSGDFFGQHVRVMSAPVSAAEDVERLVVPMLWRLDCVF